MFVKAGTSSYGGSRSVLTQKLPFHNVCLQSWPFSRLRTFLWASLRSTRLVVLELVHTFSCDPNTFWGGIKQQAGRAIYYLCTAYFLLSNPGTVEPWLKDLGRNQTACFVHQKMSTRDMNEINGEDDDWQEGDLWSAFLVKRHSLFQRILYIEILEHKTNFWNWDLCITWKLYIYIFGWDTSIEYLESEKNHLIKLFKWSS